MSRQWNVSLFAWAVLVSLSAGWISAEEWTVDQLIDRHAQARGGSERWDTAQRLEIQGTYTAFSVRQPFRVWRQAPDLFRFESVILDLPTTYAAGPSGPWWIEPVFGLTWARRPIGPFEDLLARRALFKPLLLLAREAEYPIEFLGEGDVDGVPTLDLQVTLPSGATETWHLDPETFLEHAVDSVTYDYTQTLDPIQQRAWFSDFREVDGLILPHRVEQEYLARHTLLEIQKAQADGELDSSLFRMPLNEGMERLRPLVGTWRVTVETRSSEEAPWSSQETTSTITPHLDGALLQENIRWTSDGDPLEAFRQYSFDRFRKVFRLSQVNNMTHHMALFEGTEEDGKIELSNATTGTDWSFGGMHFVDRAIFRDLTENAFVIDGYSSRDGGKTWGLLLRFSYQRTQE